MPKTLCPGDCFGFRIFQYFFGVVSKPTLFACCIVHNTQSLWPGFAHVKLLAAGVRFTFQAIQACADTSTGNGQRIWKLPKRGAPFKRCQLKATSNQLWPLFYWPSSLALWAAG